MVLKQKQKQKQKPMNFLANPVEPKKDHETYHGQKVTKW